MKIIKTVFIFLILLISCDENKDIDQPDCSLVLCESIQLYIEFVDENSNLNYIDSNQIALTDIVFTDEDLNLNPRNIELIKDEKGVSILAITAIETSFITLPNKESISISMEITLPKTNHCCDLGTLENVAALNYESSYDGLTNTLLIKI